MVDPGSTEPGDPALELLRAALEHLDPVPTAVRQAAVDALGWRTVDAELAELSYDSLLDEADPVGVRGTGGPRLVTFTAPALTVEVEVIERGRDLRVLGQLVPPAAARVEVRHRDGTVATDADEIGRFSVEGVTSGPVSIRCDPGPPQLPVETAWVTL